MYHIYLVIRLRFFSFQNNSKNLDPSYKIDLDFWDCYGPKSLSNSITSQDSLSLSWFNWWVSFAPKFQCCYFCESSCLFYHSFKFDFCVSKIMHV